jgi:hypothetical protein
MIIYLSCTFHGKSEQDVHSLGTRDGERAVLTEMSRMFLSEILRCMHWSVCSFFTGLWQLAQERTMTGGVSPATSAALAAAQAAAAAMPPIVFNRLGVAAATQPALPMQPLAPIQPAVSTRPQNQGDLEQLDQSSAAQTTELVTLLAQARLAHYQDALSALGVAETSDLHKCSDDQLVEVGMTTVELRRLRRKLGNAYIQSIF